MQPPPAPPSVDERVANVLARHRERVAALEQVGKAERALGAELQRTLALKAHEPRSGLLSWFLGGKSKKNAAPLLQTLWERHEKAVEKVRALGHHVDALERDLCLVQQDMEQIGEDACAAARDRETAERAIPEAQRALAATEIAHIGAEGAKALEMCVALDRMRSHLWTLQRDEERACATESRFVGLLEILRETRGTMERLHASLEQLHEAGTNALSDLERRLTVLAAGATARDLAEQTAGAMDALRETLHVVSNLADENATFLDERVDAMDARMHLLDARSATEKHAREEVETALKRVIPP